MCTKIKLMHVNSILLCGSLLDIVGFIWYLTIMMFIVGMSKLPYYCIHVLLNIHCTYLFSTLWDWCVVMIQIEVTFVCTDLNWWLMKNVLLNPFDVYTLFQMVNFLGRESFPFSVVTFL